MAQQVNVVLVDDLDGSEATGTVTFDLDGRSYEIDLSDENAARLRDILARYIAAARCETRTESEVATRTRAPAGNQEETAAIRRWARENGLDVSERGRIADATMQAYIHRDSTPAPEIVAEAPTKRARLEAIANPFRITKATG